MVTSASFHSLPPISVLALSAVSLGGRSTVNAISVAQQELREVFFNSAIVRQVNLAGERWTFTDISRLLWAGPPATVDLGKLANMSLMNS